MLCSPKRCARSLGRGYMSLTIALERTGEDRAEARHGADLLATFEPRALLVDQPLHPSHPLPAGPVVYGKRLWAALGGPALTALVAALPFAPDPESAIAIRTDDADLAAIPWEYLHGVEDFLIFDYLFVREIAKVRR